MFRKVKGHLSKRLRVLNLSCLCLRQESEQASEQAKYGLKQIPWKREKKQLNTKPHLAVEKPSGHVRLLKRLLKREGSTIGGFS
jgi:hypothetical protein